MNKLAVPHSVSKHPVGPQAGGAAILLALIILVVMSLAAFGVARNALRDLAIVGTVTQGTKAEQAADAGLDWFIIWTHPDTATTATSITGNRALISKLADAKSLTWGDPAQPNTTRDLNAVDPYFKTRLWDQAFRLTSTDTDNQTSDMVFDTTNYDGKTSVRQDQANYGNRVAQKFNLTVRFLGMDQPTLTSGGGNFSGNTQGGSTSTQNLRWQVISEGQASLDLGGVYQRYSQRREIIGVQALSQTVAP